MTSVTGRWRGARVGVFGGTFDPPHIGHLAAAVSAGHELGLDVVALVPNGQPWQKEGSRTITPAVVRLEMVEAAARGVPGVEVSDLEVRRPGPSFTVDTVAELRAAGAAEVVVVLGRDAAALIPTWERHEELLASATLAVVERPGPPVAVPAVVRHVVLDVPRIDVSSSELRSWVARGRPIDVLVPAGAVAVIERHRLYRT